MRKRLFNYFKSFFVKELAQLENEVIERVNQSRASELTKVIENITKQERDYQQQFVDQRVDLQYTKLNWLVNPDDVFQVSKNTGVAYLGLEPISKNEAIQLKSEAELLMGMRLYKILTNTLTQEAINIAVLNSKEWENVISGKMMIHNLTVIKKIVERMALINTSKLPNNSEDLDIMVK